MGLGVAFDDKPGTASAGVMPVFFRAAANVPVDINVVDERRLSGIRVRACLWNLTLDGEFFVGAQTAMRAIDTHGVLSA